jgi:hypothetical protein
MGLRDRSTRGTLTLISDEIRRIRAQRRRIPWRERTRRDCDRPQGFQCEPLYCSVLPWPARLQPRLTACLVPSPIILGIHVLERILAIDPIHSSREVLPANEKRIARLGGTVLVLECLTVIPRSAEICVGDERSFAFRVGGTRQRPGGRWRVLGDSSPKKNGVDSDEDNSELDRAGSGWRHPTFCRLSDPSTT